MGKEVEDRAGAIYRFYQGQLESLYHVSVRPWDDETYVFLEDLPVGKGLKVQREAQIEDFRIHDLRYTFASLLVSGGASLEMIGKLLGHTKMQTTQRLRFS